MRIKIPIIIGKNRLRGNSTGAMVDENEANHLDHLRKILCEEAIAAGVTPSSDWLSTAVAQILKLYEQAHSEWIDYKGGTIGHVYEASLPSGKILLLGDARVLARIQ